MSLRRHTRSVSATGQTAPAPAWLGILSDLRRALATAAYKVFSCRRATHAENSTLRGRMRAFRRIERAYDRLSAASEQLQRAVAALRAMAAAAAAEPATAGAASLAILGATRDIVRMSARVVEMSVALDAAAALVEQNPKSIGRPRPIPDWLCSRYPVRPLERIRRRTRCQTVEDAPRRISRGRAPPFLSICSL
jgi:hypothetical protein